MTYNQLINLYTNLDKYKVEKVDILLVDTVFAKHHEKLLLEKILNEMGQNVLQAHSEREALQLLERHDFAAILLFDSILNVGAYEIAAQIRQEKRSVTTPLLFITNPETAKRHPAYSLGYVDTLFRPVSREALEAKINILVDLFRKTKIVKQVSLLLKHNYQDFEKQLQINASKTKEVLKKSDSFSFNFTSLISHELKAPLSVIKEAVDLLLNARQDPITEGQKEILSITKNNVDKLNHLISNLFQNKTPFKSPKKQTTKTSRNSPFLKKRKETKNKWTHH